MSLSRPPATQGLKHLALSVQDLDACLRFYQLLGFEVEWQPDADNVYLSSGADNLALHRVPAFKKSTQTLDHLGLLFASPEQVDAWYAYLSEHQVSMVKPPKTHRDGAHSFYCLDPDGNCVQMLYHPPISK